MTDKELEDEVKKINMLGETIWNNKANPNDKNWDYYVEALKVVSEEIVAAKSEQQKRSKK